MANKNTATYSPAVDQENVDHTVSNGIWKKYQMEFANVQHDLLTTYFNNYGAVPWQIFKVTKYYRYIPIQII
jgi:hypothetical protein